MFPFKDGDPNYLTFEVSAATRAVARAWGLSGVWEGCERGVGVGVKGEGGDRWFGRLSVCTLCVYIVDLSLDHTNDPVLPTHYVEC